MRTFYLKEKMDFKNIETERRAVSLRRLVFVATSQFPGKLSVVL